MPTLALLIAVLVIIALFLIGGVFRYLRQELQETPEDRRRNRPPRQPQPPTHEGPR